MHLPTALGLFCLAAVATAARRGGGCDTTDKSFDYLSLVAQYPPTAGSNITHFTLHGMWPSRTGSREISYPCNCNSEAFDASKLSSIMPEMISDWPSFGHPNIGFWTHEWTKHGTCAEQLPSLDGQLDYFSSALNLLKKAGMMAALSKAGIVPSATKDYQAAAILAAIKKSSGVTISLGCKNQAGQQHLADVAICHDKQLNAVDCDTSVVAPNNDPCDYQKPIVLGVGGHAPSPTPGPSPGPSPGPGPEPVCTTGHHGPKCTTDADCKGHPGCIRCAHSGYCTNQPDAEQHAEQSFWRVVDE